MTEPRDLNLYDAAVAMRRGRLTSVELVQSCLERIAERDESVLAWANLYADEALEEAQQRDMDATIHKWRGPLHGLPLGIKDIYDVKGQATEAGTDAYPSRIAAWDAVSVARLRDAGAIILGKTVTTSFAMGDAGKTRNPWNPGHTPGGSSSGSGAGVADRQCLGALGTQTNGSVIRPASFNGVVGFKPGFGEISTEGIVPLSWQLDHVGTLTRTVEDASLLWRLLRERRVLDWQATRDKLPPSLLPRAPERLWRVREFFADEAEGEMTAALDAFCGQMAERGVKIVEKSLPASFAGIHDAHHALMASDAATVHREAFERDPGAYPPKIGGLIREGLEVRAVDYVAALRHRERLISQMSAALGDVDAAVFPSALGAAPEGLDSTGNPAFNTLSSIGGLPAVSLPAGLSAGGLPLGLQLLGRKDGEDALLELAGWCESVLGFDARPGEGSR